MAYGIHADFSLGPKVFQEIHDELNDFEVGILGKLGSITSASLHSCVCSQTSNLGFYILIELHLEPPLWPQVPPKVSMLHIE